MDARAYICDELDVGTLDVANDHDTLLRKVLSGVCVRVCVYVCVSVRVRWRVEPKGGHGKQPTQTHTHVQTQAHTHTHKQTEQVHYVEREVVDGVAEDGLLDKQHVALGGDDRLRERTQDEVTKKKNAKRSSDETTLKDDSQCQPQKQGNESSYQLRNTQAENV